MTLAPLAPRDAAELALARLSDFFDGHHATLSLQNAERYLRVAGLSDMAGVIAEYMGRVGGSDSDVQAVYERLWAMLDEGWPVTVESREAA